jgi:uncharacterized membrane protein YhiD involved in acid resistance
MPADLPLDSHSLAEKQMQSLQFNVPQSDPLSLQWLLINMLVGAGLALLLRWHYQRFGSTLSNRNELGQVFPFVLLTTILIITVVKSSLALSLGLVGALSIVRFRTPIKEPEELAYLFLSIGAGLGLGAHQTLPTIIATIAILSIMAVLKWQRREDQQKNLYLSLDLGQAQGQQCQLSDLNEASGRHISGGDLRPVDDRDGKLEVTYFLDVDRESKVSEMITDLRRSFPDVGVTFIDQNRLPQI